MAAHDLTVWQAILLGVVQGLTEWLPVSSSGHLVLAQEYLGIHAPIFFDVVVHVGTLIVVLVFFRKAILEILTALATLPSDHRETGSWRATLWDNHPRRLALMVVVGSVPTAVIGFTFARQIEQAFASATVVGASLLVMGTILFLTRYAPPPRAREGIDLKDGLLIGLAQGMAILPGISRSGSTIGAALFLGVERELAVRYSFLLSVPAIVGATLFQATGVALSEAWTNFSAYAAGLVSAMLVGYAALFLLVYIIRRQALHYFAYYCWAMGAIALALPLAT